MNLNQLQYALEIYKCGSISKAAQKLYITQPHLSKMLHDLEQEFGIIIFHRTKSGVEVTSEGRRFLQYADKILHDVNQFQDHFHNGSAHQEFHVATVAMSHSFEAFLQVLKRHEQHPIRCFYKEASPYEVINEVAQRKSEIGILSVGCDTVPLVKHLLRPKNLSYQVLNQSELYVVVGRNHPLTKQHEPIAPEQLYEYGIVLTPVLRGILLDHPETDLFSNLLDYKKAKKLIHVNTRAVLHNLLLRTQYVSFGTKSFLGQEEHYGLVSLPLNCVQNQDTLAEVWAIWPSSDSLSSLASEFINELAQCYQLPPDVY